MDNIIFIFRDFYIMCFKRSFMPERKLSVISVFRPWSMTECILLEPLISDVLKVRINSFESVSSCFNFFCEYRRILLFEFYDELRSFELIAVSKITFAFSWNSSESSSPARSALTSSSMSYSISDFFLFSNCFFRDSLLQRLLLLLQ